MTTFGVLNLKPYQLLVVNVLKSICCRWQNVIIENYLNYENRTNLGCS